MSEGINCKKLYEELGRLKKLKAEFDRAYEEGVEKRDFSECAPFYRKLKELLNNPEGVLKKIVEFREFINTMNLKEQYESQLKVARKTGLFKDEVGNKSALPVIERGGEEYMMPDWREVKKKLFRYFEMVKEKAEQGFSKMLIVPFASSLKDFESELRWTIISFEDRGRYVLSADGDRVPFKQDDQDMYPLVIGYNDDQLVYYPKKYDPKNHGGMTKDEVIKSSGAWQICFVENMSGIPFMARDKVGGRVRLDSKGSGFKMNIGAIGRNPTIRDWHDAMLDKNKFADAESYKYEEGMVIEQYAWMQLTYLLQGEKPLLIDFDKDQTLGTYILNSYYKLTNHVVVAEWSDLDGIFMYSGDSDDLNDTDVFGIRPIIILR